MTSILATFPDLYTHLCEIIHKKIDNLFARDVLFVTISSEFTLLQKKKIKKELQYRVTDIDKYLIKNAVDIQYILNNSELLQTFVEMLNTHNKYLMYFVKDNNVHRNLLGTNDTNIVSPDVLVTVFLYAIYDTYVLNISENYLTSLTCELK